MSTIKRYVSYVSAGTEKGRGFLNVAFTLSMFCVARTQFLFSTPVPLLGPI